MFLPEFPQYEFAPKGYCQLVFAAYKELYEMVGEFIDLPPLSEKPQIKNYADRTFCLDWCPHVIYQLNSDTTEIHEKILPTKLGQRLHKDYERDHLPERERIRAAVKDLMELLEEDLDEEGEARKKKELQDEIEEIKKDVNEKKASQAEEQKKNQDRIDELKLEKEKQQQEINDLQEQLRKKQEERQAKLDELDKQLAEKEQKIKEM